MAKEALRSGDLARLTGVSPDTIRHYERVGILPMAVRTASGYRMYGPGAVDRVFLAQRAMRLGFTLAELSDILRVRDGGGAPCHRVLKMTEEKLRSIDREIEELRQTQRFMVQLLRQWRKKVANTRPGDKAMLLHSLVTEEMPPTKLVNGFRRRKQE
jgi:DNA-binding transcriptional MerR regulator